MFIYKPFASKYFNVIVMENTLLQQTEELWPYISMVMVQNFVLWKQKNIRKMVRTVSKQSSHMCRTFW